MQIDRQGSRIVHKCALLCVCLLCLSTRVVAQAPPEPSPLVDRVGQTGFLQLKAEGFEHLPRQQKVLAHFLCLAAIALNPIVYDQNSSYGLELKGLLEQIITHSRGIDPAVQKKLTDYTKLFWANRGNHNSFTSQKFLPEFTFQELQAAAAQALKNRARIGPKAKLEKELAELRPAVFDPNFEPYLTVKNPKEGEDPLTASGNNLYAGVTLSDLKDFHDRFPLNSRLIKKDGKLVEEVYRVGSPNGKVPPGLYAMELGRVIRYLSMAMPYADTAQKKVLRDLIDYYQTGAPADWRQFNIDWVVDDAPIDFTNGFIEVYKDVRGLKGAAQAYVTIVDEKMNKLTKAFAANAQYFEQRAPWEDKYKLEAPRPPVVNAVDAIIETADFDVTTIGENLPNEAEIHSRYGSKSFIFTGSTRAFTEATGTKVSGEFSYSDEERARAAKYAALAEDLYTAMHEVLGHGSGKMNPRLTEEPAVYLKEYYSTLEETRADLVALWNFFDPKLLELGALPDVEAARAAYDGEARSALTQLHEVPTGDTIEEDHRRGTQLIVNYIREKTGAIQAEDRDGKVYLVVKDYEQMRKGVGMLLAELMRIKAEGDYDGAKALISQYGIHFNTAWRDQVLERYKALDVPTFWCGINPNLVPHFAANGRIDDVKIVYPRDIVSQQLRYTEIAGH
jgi:dipeptidyl-peptidase-3